ncbi:MAG: hypothetical protein HC875_21150 [Anaerolineales bacterium]|nr:hypothetical protein [Anaerolineales bacterium]
MGSLTPDHIWGETLSLLRGQTTKETYAAVLQKTRLVAANGRYTIETPTEFVKSWLENRFTLPISRALGTVLDQPLEPDLLTFVVRDYMEPIDYSPDGDTVEDEGDGFYVCYREFILRGYARKFGPTWG